MRQHVRDIDVGLLSVCQIKSNQIKSIYFRNGGLENRNTW